MLLPAASPADVVLARQKDAFYRSQLAEQVSGAADLLLGAHAALLLRPELRLLAELVFWGSTQLRSRQTPGEEYCDLLLVDQTARHLAPVRTHRLPLLLVSLLLPYAVKRQQAGGLAPLMRAWKPQSAHERAAEFRRKLQRRQEQQQSQSQPRQDVDQPVELSFRQRIAHLLQRLKRRLPALAGTLVAVAVLERLHLAVFYLNGVFPTLAHRVAQVRFVFTREPTARRPSYRILGVLLLAQLALQGFSAAKQRFASRSSTLQQGHAMEEEGATSGARLLVPSMKESTAVVKVEDAAQRRKCGICLSAMTAPSCPPCGHLYCYECIVECLHSKAECPMCRQVAQPCSVICVYFALDRPAERAR